MTKEALEIIDRTIVHNRLWRLRSELEGYERLVDRESRRNAERLRTIIARLETENENKETEDTQFAKHKEAMKDAIYRNRWVALNTDIKINRLNEYFERSLLSDNDIKVRLIEMVRDKTLRPKDVEYRVEVGKIVSIKILEVVDGKYVIKDDETKTKKAGSKSGTKSASKDKPNEVAKTAKAVKTPKAVKTAKAVKTVKSAKPKNGKTFSRV